MQYRLRWGHRSENVLWRAHAMFFNWEYRGYRVRGGVEVEETKEGWLLVEMITQDTDDDPWRHYCYAIENGSLACIVPLTWDEYNNWPSMPRGWAIPF